MTTLFKAQVKECFFFFFFFFAGGGGVGGGGRGRGLYMQIVVIKNELNFPVLFCFL